MSLICLEDVFKMLSQFPQCPLMMSSKMSQKCPQDVPKIFENVLKMSLIIPQDACIRWYDFFLLFRCLKDVLIPKRFAKKGTLNQIFFYVEIYFWKVTKFQQKNLNKFFAKKKYHWVLKKLFVTLSHCVKEHFFVTLCLRKNVCHTESLCLRKNGKKQSKTVKNGLKKTNCFLMFLTVFDCFWSFFLKHSDSVWQTFFY